MSVSSLRQRVLAGEILAGTFLKTPAYELIEVLARSGLDFICLDAEHAPFDRARMDCCLAMGRALGFPLLVRVPSGRPDVMLAALDSGAVGLVVPHVDSVEKAREVSRAARFGQGGRGYAGSTRWGGYASRPMRDLLEKSAQETLLIAQIEEPSGVEAVAEIAAVEGVDALFVGPADLSVAYGHDTLDNPDLAEGYARVGAACRNAGKGYATWIPSAEHGAARRGDGVHIFFTGSEHGWMLAGARAAGETLHALRDD
ncbi:aldolase/citrate lyase family protein [Tropicimonas sp. TH_r6]|uniref:HpcH/HpaI aldolase family protein n=1 Tax=Tropicimonas sp. TH_r6 TaxID=3082085 RepID=UPI0029541E7E|nr:aldolase/citrate lyase family protein [Tropicimonas sp. TH_r6]MDV7143929.1 aldolase/citrate lyase family protein [Tropicimonas sp. TH_r6]